MSITKMCSVETFKINTKGMCLLCLDNCADNPNNCSKERLKLSFKVLLRYLKINVLELTNFSSSILKSMDGNEEVEAEVSLCDRCCAVTTRFSEFYKDFEQIRLQMDVCVQSLHDLIKEGEQSEMRTEEYERRMRTRNPFELFNVSVVENLRKETMRKCLQRVNSNVPRVTLTSKKTQNWTSTNPQTVKLFSTPNTNSRSRVVAVKSGSNMQKRIRLNPQEEASYSTTEEKNDFETTLDIDEQYASPEEFKSQIDIKPAFPVVLKTVANHNANDEGQRGERETENSLSFYSENNDDDEDYEEPEETPKKKWTCRTCKRSYTSFALLRRHQITFHNSKPPASYRCTLCDRSFSYSSNLRVHQIVLHTVESFANSLPNGVTKEQLDTVVDSIVQQASYSPIDQKKPFGCPFCDRKFRKRIEMKPHFFHNHLDKVMAILLQYYPELRAETGIKAEETFDPLEMLSVTMGSEPNTI